MRVLVTGSSGLVGSEAVFHFSRRGYEVVGVDNGERARFFGPDGDTSAVRASLEHQLPSFRPLELDIRDREAVLSLLERERPDAVVHCAAQPSHDLAAQIPFADFDINAVGTLNLLEAVRRAVPTAPFVFASTNKVYGDGPNGVPLVETERRWDFATVEHAHGIDERFPIDQSLHSLFGASKVAADVLCQEYGRYFEMPVGIFRAGCLTGARHAGAEQHGFLAYLVRAVAEGRRYTVFGHAGKQVRDQLHCSDVVRAFEAFIEAPRPGQVYNLGGGRPNSASVLESIERVEAKLGRRLDVRLDGEARVGDHICYYSDTTKLRAHYPTWSIRLDLDAILDELTWKWRSVGTA